MELTIHGKIIVYDGSECGIYKAARAISTDYALMDVPHLVETINGLPKDRAIEAVTALRDRAAQQAQWQQTPRNLGFPILREVPEPDIAPIDRVRGNIENTKILADEILRVLRGD